MAKFYVFKEKKRVIMEHLDEKYYSKVKSVLEIKHES